MSNEERPAEASPAPTSNANVDVLRYEAGWMVNGISWSNTPENPYRFAISSFLPEYINFIDIVQKDENDKLVVRATAQHYYPPTKIMFAPKSYGNDHFITTADYLRLWKLEDGAPEPVSEKDESEYQLAQQSAEGPDKIQEMAYAGKQKANQPTINTSVKLAHLFDNTSKQEFCSPVTSCDWNADAPHMVATSSIDTTVTIWDVNTHKTTTQLIAHDKDVYDVAFASGQHTFASCGADGSVRLFDLREMEHCTIVYESPGLKPLMRVAWNKLDHTYLASFSADGTEVAVVDIRYPSAPVGTLQNHTGPINSVSWAPHSSTHLCSAGEDHRVLIWTLNELPNVAPSQYLGYEAQGPVNSVSWSSQHEDWIACSCGTEAQLLHV